MRGCVGSRVLTFPAAVAWPTQQAKAKIINNPIQLTARVAILLVSLKAASTRYVCC